MMSCILYLAGKVGIGGILLKDILQYRNVKSEYIYLEAEEKEELN